MGPGTPTPLKILPTKNPDPAKIVTLETDMENLLAPTPKTHSRNGLTLPNIYSEMTDKMLIKYGKMKPFLTELLQIIPRKKE